MTTLAEQIRVEKTGPDTFISSSLPVQLGNRLPIAYGGCTIAAAVNSAVQTVQPQFHLYSVLGNFLGPTSTEVKLQCRVSTIRDTRTFATRRVEVTQTLKNGATRLCLVLTADFQIREPTMYEYSAPPSIAYSQPEECPTIEQSLQDLTAKGYMKGTSLATTMNSFFESRFCPEGVWGQNLGGTAKTAPTTQDDLPITSKVSGDWFRGQGTISSTAEHLAALAFMMDGGLSFTPLVHDHKFLEDAGACSTLDFALRIFVHDIDITQWHLRERSTSSGGAARTFADGRLWNRQGKLVASMSQQSIMRPSTPRAAL